MVKRILSSKWYVIAVMVVLSCLVAVVFWRKDLQAKWGLIDDHEIMSYLGEDKTLSLQEIPETLFKTEVGAAGDSVRFRPVYYSLRLIETSIWGYNYSLWYITRIALFATSFAIVWITLKKYFGFILGGLIPLSLALENYWLDIFARLGPSEPYTVLGLAIFTWGFMRYYNFLKSETKSQTKIKSVVYSLAIALGVITCVGSKENFIFLPLLNLLLVAYMCKRKKIDWIFIVSTICATIFSLGVYYAIFVAVSKTGADIYGNDTSFGARAYMTMKFIPQAVQNLHVIVILIATGIVHLVFKHFSKIKDNKYQLYWSVWLFVLIVLILLMYLSQYFFYNGVWPTGSRYDFPGEMCDKLIVVCFLYYLKKIFDRFGLKETVKEIAVHGTHYLRQVLGKIWTNRIISEVVIIMLLLGSILMSDPVSKYHNIQAGANRNAIVTASFTNTLSSTIEFIKANPDFIIIYDSYSVWDYEPVTSVGRYLRANEINKPVYLRLNNYSPDTVREGLEHRLASELLTISLNGGEFGGQTIIKYQDLIDDSGKCIVLSFNHVANSKCQAFILQY